MRRNSLKWTVVGGALAIIIMYGIEMSSSGIERVYGPLDSEPYTDTVTLEPSVKVNEHLLAQQKKIAQLERELAELKRQSILAASSYGNLTDVNERLPGIPVQAEQTTVNRIADSTSGLLQNMSSEGIKMVVSIFDGLTK
ncbi:hypothetical protein FHS15_002503 [Paenibacillus castaneae]|uniref:hypothetical protein n=1 Tax=Paenibacillus castaneae TaxID=474957 RepID=UPI000C99BD8B|nr:hypothetical protein [Paenibacillus castaneae]NIK77367.1 hypothetical protein [Paenibacillus castaneae]